MIKKTNLVMMKKLLKMGFEPADAYFMMQEIGKEARRIKSLKEAK